MLIIAYEQAVIMHDQRHIHVIMNIIVNPSIMWVVGGFCGCGGSVWVMGEWAVGQWIVGVTSFQKIYGLYSVEHHKVEKWSYYVGCRWVLWVWWDCVGDGEVGSGSLDTGSHQLSENTWFV